MRKTENAESPFWLSALPAPAASLPFRGGSAGVPPDELLQFFPEPVHRYDAHSFFLQPL